jgi:adenine deaminase
MRDPVDAAVRARAVRAALGQEPFDLLMVNATVVDVGTGELREADIGVVGSLISSVHPRGERSDAAEIADCGGAFLSPGLIDMHVHFESSMLTPGAYASAVAPRGTTTIFCDPHELANVAGVAGVRYAVDASRGLPVRFIVQAPSCVPPQPGLELSGHDLGAADITEMLSWPEVSGLAEVMDMLGVLGADERMVGVVAAGLDSGKLVSGHAAGLGPAQLQAYLSAGIESDHEVFAQGDVLARLRAGLTVELRGMLDGLLPEIVAQLAALPELPTHIVLCTDDLFAATLLSEGGVDHLVRRLVAYGLPPVRALRCATYHAAYRLGRSDLGLLAAGRAADIVVLEDLESFRASSVYASGRLIARDGALVVPCTEGPSSPPLLTVHLSPVSPGDFVLRVDQSALSGPAPRVGPSDEVAAYARLRSIHGIINTAWGETDVELRSGAVVVPDDHILQAVVHRHGRIAPQVQLALVSGWGRSWEGAIATTVSHDTHNLVVFGRDPVDMAAAANAVIATHGGVAVASGGKVKAQVALPIAGILSDRPAAEVAANQHRVLAAARQVGLPEGSLSQPLMQVLAASLACLPGPHLTDLGLIDGTTGELVAEPVLS